MKDIAVVSWASRSVANWHHDEAMCIQLQHNNLAIGFWTRVRGNKSLLVFIIIWKQYIPKAAAWQTPFLKWREGRSSIHPNYAYQSYRQTICMNWICLYFVSMRIYNRSRCRLTMTMADGDEWIQLHRNRPLHNNNILFVRDADIKS